MHPPITVDDLMGLGLSERSAYLYSRLIVRAAVQLEAAGTDLMACGAADVARVAAAWPNSHSARAQLRAALLKAWDHLEREHPPIRAIRIPPKPRARCKALPEGSAEQLERAAWARDDDRGLAVLIGMYAALRRLEIARLRWEDVTVDEHGRPVWLRVHGKYDLVADVPIHPALAEALTRRRRPTGWLFPGRYGGSVCANTIWEWVRKVADEAGLSQVPTHVLRHTALAEANDRSHDLRTVQEIARHSRPEITAGYTRVKDARMLEVIAMIDYGRNAA